MPAMVHTFLPELKAMPLGLSIAIGAVSLFLFLFYIRRLSFFSGKKTMECSKIPTVPAVPGLPVIGNLLQLREKKPHKTFLKWAETYGPIYSIKTGASALIVLNSTDVAKEAMVTRYSSISTRKLSSALKVLTNNKSLVAISDYDEFYKMAKRYLLTGLLGANAQKQRICYRNAMMENLSSQFHSHAKSRPGEPVNFREIFQAELFRLALKQALGKDVETIYVEELGTTLTREAMLKILVTDMMEGAIDVDWRDFFPYLKFIPNKPFETRIQEKHFRRMAVMKALIKEHDKQTDVGEEPNGYLHYLLSEGKTLREEQIAMLVWETIVETSDTTMVTTEWALYELAKNHNYQDRLFGEIQSVCGHEKIKEEQLPQLRYLGGVFHETLRKYSPAPLVPLRYVHEDTQIGGYYIPAGSEIAINIHGCNMDKKQWESPEEWRPERFLDGRYEHSDLYKTMAFGAGKRVCAGSLQAATIASVAIGRLVQEFEWMLEDGEEEDVGTLGLTSQKLHPLKAVIVARNQE